MFRKCLALTLCLPLLALAQSKYPDKPVHMVVPFSPGGATDSAMRLLARDLSAAFGQQFLVENRPGANGRIAGEAVAKAAPDGYTLFAATNTPMAANPFLYKSMPFNPVDDFVPVARVALVPYVLVVAPSQNIATVSDLISAAKAQPGKLSYAAGAATGIVAGEALKRAAGIDLLQVPYKSNPPAIADVLNGRVTVMFTDVVSGLGQIRAGQLRPLAVTTLKRTAILPDVPTMDELGWKRLDIYGWSAIFAPRGTPQAVVDALAQKILEILATASAQEGLLKLGLEAAPGGPKELRGFLQSELAKWERLVRDAGIQPE